MGKMQKNITVNEMDEEVHLKHDIKNTNHRPNNYKQIKIRDL